MGPLDKYILADNALKATEAGFELQFRSHWYRSLPLSCMDFKVKVNGEIADNKNMLIEANGNKYLYDEMPDLDKEWLFILDKATLHVRHPTALKAGQQYQVTLNLDLYIPYILVGPESKPLMAGSQVTKTLTCR